MTSGISSKFTEPQPTKAPKEEKQEGKIEKISKEWLKHLCINAEIKCERNITKVPFDFEGILSGSFYKYGPENCFSSMQSLEEPCNRCRAYLDTIQWAQVFVDKDIVVVKDFSDAIQKDNLEAVTILIPEISNEDLFDHLLFRVCKRKKPAIKKLLLKTLLTRKNISNIRLHSGDTLLNYLGTYYPNLAKAFIIHLGKTGKKEDLNKKDTYTNLYPLEVANEHRDTEIFKLLLENGADITIPCKDRRDRPEQFFETLVIKKNSLGICHALKSATKKDLLRSLEHAVKKDFSPTVISRLIINELILKGLTIDLLKKSFKTFYVSRGINTLAWENLPGGPSFDPERIQEFRSAIIDSYKKEYSGQEIEEEKYQSF